MNIHNISYYSLALCLLSMSINISKYITEVEKLMTQVIQFANDKKLEVGSVHESDIIKILLSGAYELSKVLATEIYKEIKEKEGISYPANSNEMNLMAMGVIFSAWTSWIFKAKSEDINRNVESRNQARCVSNYVKSIIENAITGGWKIGVDNKRPENTFEYINIV